jgi:hypothetical protein
MLKTANLKLYRKFLVLSVLALGLFMASSINKAGANPCCSICTQDYNDCVTRCNIVNPANPPKCIEESCDPAYNWCINNCDIC